MVRATTSLETVRKDLESVEGGWVELRPMTYAQFLQRRDMAMKMGVQGARGGVENINVDILQETVSMFEFKIAIADHNLEDENGRKLALGTPEDFRRLDPQIGQEISDLIDEMNQWESPKSSGEVSTSSPSSDTVSEGSVVNEDQS
ncbi:MAG: hypothetical protein ACW99G_20250 [Candidatus Thorarchaeota archaeon]|jgi:hypothetical protein